MPPEITFPDWGPQPESFSDSLSFPAVVDGRKVKCVVTLDFLWERFGARSPLSQELAKVFQEHRQEIQEIARSQILAGNITADNVVLLTSTTFRLAKVDFGERIRQTGDLYTLAKKATELLEEVLGSNPWLVTAEWDRGEDARGRAVVTLRLSDYTGSVTGVFDPKELESPSQTRKRLYRLWIDLLQVRSHRQLENLLKG